MYNTTIILCTYNEVSNIEDTIKLIIKSVKNVKIIVIDDNSNDGTIKKLSEIKSIYNFDFIVRRNERGLASALREGFLKSVTNYMGFIDVNSKDQILQFPEMISKLKTGYDISVLSRYIKGGGDKRVPLRVFTSWLINLLCKLFLRINFNDFTSGIFIMKKEVFNNIIYKAEGHGEFFIEFIYKAYKKDYKIAEVPYIQKEDLNLSISKSNPNIIRFFYLGYKYFLRLLLTKFNF